MVGLLLLLTNFTFGNFESDAVAESEAPNQTYRYGYVDVQWHRAMRVGLPVLETVVHRVGASDEKHKVD